MGESSCTPSSRANRARCRQRSLERHELRDVIFAGGDRCPAHARRACAARRVDGAAEDGHAVEGVGDRAHLALGVLGCVGRLEDGLRGHEAPLAGVPEAELRASVQISKKFKMKAEHIAKIPKCNSFAF